MSRHCFPISLVEHVDPNTLVQPRRTAPGEMAASGTLRFSANPAELRAESDSRGEEIMRGHALLKLGRDALARHASRPVVRAAFERLAKRGVSNARVAWMRDHDAVADALGGNDPVLRVDVAWLGALGEGMSPPEGLAELGALVWLYAASVFGGEAQRETLHALLDFAGGFSESERAALIGLLKRPEIDGNAAFRLFLEISRDQSLASELEQLDLAALSDVRTPLLFAAGDHLEHALFTRRRQPSGGELDLPDCLKDLARRTNGEMIEPDEVGELTERLRARGDAVKLIEKTLKWRDRWVTWLIGQQRVNMPYDNERVVRIMRQPMEDVDEKRALINEAIASTYDMRLEGRNIQTISSWARESGMRLVAGRLSRAFGNQSQLLSASKLIVDKESLLLSVRALHRASMNLRELQTHSARLLHLIQQRKPTPFAQTVGALNQYEEALFAYQSREFKRMLREKDEASRRVIGRPGAESCGMALDAVQAAIRELYRLAAEFRDRLEQARKSPAAFIVLMQRLHPAETVNLANANLLRDVHPGKEDDLRDLMRIGGHYTYSSPGPGLLPGEGGGEPTHWVIHVDDWIEAIPLFIHERVVKRSVRVGGEDVTVEVIETEVDQESMEAFFRLHAGYWAQNIDAVHDSQTAGLARRLMVKACPALASEAGAFLKANPDKNDADAAWAAIHEKTALHEGVGALAALIAAYERERAEDVARLVESSGVPRIEAVERLLTEDVRRGPGAKIHAVLKQDEPEALAAAALKTARAGKTASNADITRLAALAASPTRRTSSLHILTTESAGMTEGYVQTWIEEEMALYNVVRREGLEDDVKARMNGFRTRILALARKTIAEFGMSVVIDEVMAQQRLPEPAAVMTVMTSYKPIMLEAARLGVLIERAEAEKRRKADPADASDPAEVEAYIRKHKSALMKKAAAVVAENNGKAFDKRVQALREEKPRASEYEIQKRVIEEEADYREELDAVIRFEARAAVLEAMDREHPELKLADQVGSYIRVRTQLARSTARKQAVAAAKLHALTQHPLYYYQAAGGNKRYNLLYTPSRVNLGERERDSVVKWRQWVGGADRHAAQAGFEFYSLINEGGVEERPALAYAEIQKTSENALCVTHFAGSNALALLCMAVLEGDAEDMADQMTLREDRMVPPPGEGYGGYCVPKDGLFLAFVLSLRNEVKLRQIGVPERFHGGVMKLAKHVLLHQRDFESHFDWQRWAAEKLLQYSALKKYFDLKEDLLIFHVNKIARAVENLGQPWHETTEGSKLMANLAAQWGVERMIIRAEQVNRFMVFYKAWMIYDALREARKDHPRCPAENEAAIVLSAEYKPVQDVRFSTGMRLFEIFAQTGEHLTHSLDEEGQNLAWLMAHGFDPDDERPAARRMLRQLASTFQLDFNNKETIARLREAFPAHQPPGDLVVISSTMSSTQDLLFYTSDAKLDEIATQAQTLLGDYGLTEDQIRANATVYGGRLRRWAGVKQLPVNEQDDLIARVGGGIHALVLKMRGPGRSYDTDIQGADVINTGIPFSELIDRFDDAPRLIAMMRAGNPDSALVVADGAAGRARRVLTFFDVMQFFAACERIGRRGVYRAIGLGRRVIDRLREEMHRKRERAERLYEAVEAAALAEGAAKQTEAARAALALYHGMQGAITLEEEAHKALREEEKLKRYKKWKARDSYISQALIKISAGLPLQRLDWGTWTAGVGGVFAVIGEPEAAIQQRRERWELGIAAIARLVPEEDPADVQAFSGDELVALCASLIRPEFQPESERFTQQMLVESSSKAVEIAAREALERRKALKVRAERARAFNRREDGFRETFREDDAAPFDEIWSRARERLVSIQTDLAALQSMPRDSEKRRVLQDGVHQAFGGVVGLARLAFARLASDVMPETTAEQRSARRRILDDLALVYTGREIVFENLKKLAGGYEDIGGIARMAEAARGDRAALERIARAIELFYVTFALAQTLEFAAALPEDVDEALFWKNLTDFFAETINDHWYEYWPWAYSRGAGFEAIPRDERMALAVERHAWLYEYLRGVMVYASELKQWNAADRDALLGNFAGDHTITAIGANAPTETERRWRAYNQLREIAFMKSDGFAIPPVFDSFDPDIIDAGKRVNLAILFPVGRTHVSRALREGPTLNRELRKKKKRGANILITRYNDFVEVDGARRKALLITDGHLYISEKEFEQALAGQGLKKKAVAERVKAAREDGRLTAKGIRVAARFMQKGEPAPIAAGGLIPFHGLPLYINGQSEAEGMPATIQSRILSDLTYDKSIYPQIYTARSGVHLPPEIDWKNAWNEGLSEDGLLERIIEGRDEYAGLRAFAREHPIVLIKGAAESGARNLKVFEIQDEFTRINEESLANAARFVRDVSRTQNVVIQAAIMPSPELWAAPELMERFVDRQLMEWNTPVKRDQRPRPRIYGSLRIVASSPGPKKKYDTAFPISLISLQVATNVGRGGTLETLRPELIQPRYRKAILDGLRAEGPKVLEAMNAYIKKHGREWEKTTGQKIGTDLRGASYGWANYLMCDYLVMPVFKRNGRLVDIRSDYNEAGERVGATAILQDDKGRFEGEIAEWRFIHLEPNVGIGLWDRYNLREEVHEREAAEAEKRKFNWDHVGVSDRIVLTNFILSGEEYLDANFGGKGVSRKAIQAAWKKLK
ncbi:MAG: hypothetical protein GC154_07830 [bacterium]|nr:hypothetical protein [bacterium]